MNDQSSRNPRVNQHNPVVERDFIADLSPLTRKCSTESLRVTGKSDGMDASPRQRGAVAARNEREVDPRCNGIDVPKWRWVMSPLEQEDPT
jgi:hypothetical protein